MAIGTGKIIIGIKIEGVGKVSGATLGAPGQALYRFTTAEAHPAIDTLGLYKAWLLEDSLPTIVFSADYKTGRFTIASAPFKILSVIDDPDLDPRQYFLQTSHKRIGQVALTIDTSTPNITLTGSAVTGLDGEEVGIGRERVKMGVEGAPGVYTGCIRSIHQTPPVSVDVDDPRQVKDVYRTFKVRQRRLVTCFWLPENATSYADEQVIWAGTLKTGGWVDSVMIELPTMGLSSLLHNTTLLPEPWMGSVVDGNHMAVDGLRGLVGVPDAMVFRTKEEWGSEATRNPAAMGSTPALHAKTLVMFKDSAYEVRYVGGGPGPGARYVIDDLNAPLYGTKAIKLADVDVGDECREFFAVDPAAPGPGGGPADNILPLGGADGDALTAVEQVLTSTERGSNGLKDVGVDFGFGLPAAMLDQASFDVVRRRLGDQLRMNNSFIGAKAKPEPGLKKLEEQFLHPNDLVFTVSSTGLIGIESMHDRPEPDETIVSFGHNDLLTVPSYAAGDDRILSKAQATYKRVPGGKSLRLSYSASLAQGDTIGTNNRMKIDGGGWASDEMVLRRAMAKLFRWHEAVPILAFRTHLSADARVGQLASLTAPAVLDVQNGAIIGEFIEGGLIHIVQKSINLKEMALDYTTIYTGQRLDRLGEIAPAAEVVGWDGGTKTVTVKANEYVPASGGLYPTDVDAFNATDELLVVDEFGTLKSSGFEIVTIGVNSLVLDVAPSPVPAAGNIIVWASWNQQTATQKAQGIAIADSGGTLGSAPDQGFMYEG